MTGALAALLPSLLAQAAPPGPGDPPRLDPVALVLQASVPVKLVMVLLVVFSAAVWVVIAMKSVHLNRARSQSTSFMKAFDGSPSVEALAQGGLAPFRGSPFARIFAVAYDEARKVTHGRAMPLSDAQAQQVESVTRRAAAQEALHLESWMSLLGTIGSTSPFIGLLGTVYGIMDAFLSIGNQQSANLPVVAPKIAEALIATMIGLVAAIPAVMAYNYFARRVGELSDTMDDFASDVCARVRGGGA